LSNGNKSDMSALIKYPVIRSLVQSPFLDIIGALLVFSISYYLSFHQTIYFEGKIQFNISFDELSSYVKRGAYPLGIFSILGAVFSMLATRFTGKQKNLGNVLGAVTTVNSGANDFLFGNASAIITYPLTFFIFTFAIKRWAGGEKIRKIDSLYYIIIFISILVGYALVFLGASIFGGRNELNFLVIVSLTFGISLGANICNALKYNQTWISWIVYNGFQLVKNSILGNFANVIKYIFYLFNAVITQIDWKFNGDINPEPSVV